jgi:hypothetical protein
MAKVKIQGNASGTGILTVTAPNTSTDRTITLPDATGTLATTADVPSSITDNGDSTAITIDSSERVAIGNTDAGNYYSYADNLVVYDATDHAGITIASGGTGKTCNLYFADGTSAPAVYEGYIEYQHNNNAMIFGVNHATQLSIDSTGAVTKPNQPAFLAWQNASSTIVNNTWTDIQFATERFDTGGDFNSATGIFTAPVTGKYQINYNVRIDGIAATVAHASVQIYTSNQDYAYQTIITPTAYDSILNYTSFNGSLLVDMDANDTAKLRSLINGSNGSYGGWTGTTFSAHLVC